MTKKEISLFIKLVTKERYADDAALQLVYLNQPITFPYITLLVVF